MWWEGWEGLGWAARHHKLWERCGTAGPVERACEWMEEGMVPPLVCVHLHMTRYHPHPSPTTANPCKVALWSHRDRNATETRKTLLMERRPCSTKYNSHRTQLPLDLPSGLRFPSSCAVPWPPIRCSVAARHLWSPSSPCHWL